MMPLRTLSFAALAALFSLSACDGDSDTTDDSHDHGDSEEEALVMTDGYTWHVSWARQSGDIITGEDFEIMVRVGDSDDTEIANPLTEGIQIAVDAEMEAHGHGMQDGVVPAVDQMGDGFHVTGMNFHMEGDWTLHVDVTEGELTERASFNVPCCDG